MVLLRQLWGENRRRKVYRSFCVSLSLCSLGEQRGAEKLIGIRCFDFGSVCPGCSSAKMGGEQFIGLVVFRLACVFLGNKGGQKSL